MLTKWLLGQELEYHFTDLQLGQNFVLFSGSRESLLYFFQNHNTNKSAFTQFCFYFSSDHLFVSKLKKK